MAKKSCRTCAHLKTKEGEKIRTGYRYPCTWAITNQAKIDAFLASLPVAITNQYIMGDAKAALSGQSRFLAHRESVPGSIIPNHHIDANDGASCAAYEKKETGK